VDGEGYDKMNNNNFEIMNFNPDLLTPAQLEDVERKIAESKLKRQQVKTWGVTFRVSFLPFDHPNEVINSRCDFRSTLVDALPEFIEGLFNLKGVERVTDIRVSEHNGEGEGPLAFGPGDVV